MFYKFIYIIQSYLAELIIGPSRNVITNRFRKALSDIRNSGNYDYKDADRIIGLLDKVRKTRTLSDWKEFELSVTKEPGIYYFLKEFVNENLEQLRVWLSVE